MAKLNPLRGEFVVDTAYPGVVIEPWQPDGDDAA